MTTFTSSEVRATAHKWPNWRVGEMLHAYADRLEADEKAVPVYQHRNKNGPMLRWFDCSEETFIAMEHNKHDREHFDRRILYTHPAPSDPERLAEALRQAMQSLRTIERGAMREEGLEEAENVRAYARSRAGVAESALAAHSAQAQPPAASATKRERKGHTEWLQGTEKDGGGTTNYVEPVWVWDEPEQTAASVTIDAVMRVIDGQRRLPYRSIDEKQAFRNELEAALAAQENPNG